VIKFLPPKHRRTQNSFSCSPLPQLTAQSLPPPKLLLATPSPLKSTLTPPTLSSSLDPSVVDPTAQASGPSLIQPPLSPLEISTSVPRLQRHFPTWWQPFRLQRIMPPSPSVALLSKMANQLPPNYWWLSSSNCHTIQRKGLPLFSWSQLAPMLPSTPSLACLSSSRLK
jgi:hypothetical protein